MTTETSSPTVNPEKYYEQKEFAWLIEEGEVTVCENIDGKNNENNENIENIENTNTNSETNNSILNSKEKLFQENLFEDENSSQEESTQEETSRSRAGSSSSSSLYTAELVRAHRSVDSSSSSNGSENEISSPIKPLKAVTTQTTTTISTRNSNSNVYEILQEIKPEHPLRIHTNFDFATTRPSSISLISLNPLLHHHRNSTYNNPSPTSVNYIPPRRYSNFQRNSFYNNNNAKYPSCIEETDNNNNLTIRQLHATNITQEKNTHLLNEEKIMYGKYLFWAGFLFMPVWWVGCFYKPSSTEDYKWRKRCRKASTWSFVISIVILTFIVVVNQRLKVGL